MTVPQIKVKVVRKAQIKVRTLVNFPANVVGQQYITITNNAGTYTIGVDYTLLSSGPIIDPTTAYVAVRDVSVGLYKQVTLASLLTSGLDADLQAIAALTGSGVLSRTGSGTWALRTITGTANEITVTNGDGVAGNETISLPVSLTFTGKTIAGGTFNSPTFVVATDSALGAAFQHRNQFTFRRREFFSLPRRLPHLYQRITKAAKVTLRQSHRITDH